MNITTKNQCKRKIQCCNFKKTICMYKKIVTTYITVTTWWLVYSLTKISVEIDLRISKIWAGMSTLVLVVSWSCSVPESEPEMIWVFKGRHISLHTINFTKFFFAYQKKRPKKTWNEKNKSISRKNSTIYVNYSTYSKNEKSVKLIFFISASYF